MLVIKPATLALISLVSVTLAQTQTYLTLTAIVTDSNNNSAFECWNLSTPFRSSITSGIAGARTLTFSNVTGAAYAVIPPRFDGGIHNAPVPQLVHFVSGLAHVTLPANSSAGLWLLGGASGVVIAADTTGGGHVTRYPSDESTVGLMLPFSGGVVPAHEVVGCGPCASNLGRL